MATLKDDLIEQLLKDVDFSKLTPEQITGESRSGILISISPETEMANMS